jgi:hypothetical protein
MAMKVGGIIAGRIVERHLKDETPIELAKDARKEVV